ncbi:MAG: hypothetical protein HY789_07090 [Deltaproteobacteria bacterium]|nr:hypothetical protein [Deltaproteobacteria bacterium]
MQREARQVDEQLQQAAEKIQGADHGKQTAGQEDQAHPVEADQCQDAGCLLVAAGLEQPHRKRSTDHQGHPEQQ